jgi:hypothetical protein
MRGNDEQQLDVFSYVNPEQRVPQDHPLRPLRTMTDAALQQLRPRFLLVFPGDSGESRKFLDHRHDPAGCDLIVCWKHTWTRCPENLEVLELSSVLQRP